MIDFRLYLPESWLDDTQRRLKCGVPDETVFHTKAELGLEMIRAFNDSELPFSWVGMDCHYGEQPWLLKELNSKEICYLAEIPSDSRVFKELPKTEIPPRKGNRGRHPTKSLQKVKQRQEKCVTWLTVSTNHSGLLLPSEKLSVVG